MLMNFKSIAEDEECPVPDEVRDALLSFHKNLLSHCGQSNSFSTYIAKCNLERNLYTCI